MAGMVPFSWEDPFNLESQLTEDERMIRDAAHGFAQSEIDRRAFVVRQVISVTQRGQAGDVFILWRVLDHLRQHRAGCHAVGLVLQDVAQISLCLLVFSR